MFWWWVAGCIGSTGGPSVATFNIEDFPRDSRQVDAAMAEIRSLGVDVVALQEIVRPDALRAAAIAKLGPSWRFVTHEGDAVMHHVGVLYDGDVYTLDYARVHRATAVTRGARPTVEVRLVAQRGGDVLRLFVVHLKAGASGIEVRRAQLAALAPLVVSGVEDQLLVLGDFNTATPPDRLDLAAFAEATSLQWSSQGLGCTALHPTPQGCRGTALDHVLSSDRAEVMARGPCERLGCSPGDRCPTFSRWVSDHCPVTVD